MGFLDWITGASPQAVVAKTVADSAAGIFSSIDDIIKDVHLSPESQIKYDSLKLQLTAQLQLASLQSVMAAQAMQGATKSRMPAILTIGWTIAAIAANAVMCGVRFSAAS